LYRQKQEHDTFFHLKNQSGTMEDNNNHTKKDATEYIRSRNMGNTMDNKQRHTKKEDTMSPDYTNPPIGDHEQANEPGAGEANSNEDNRSAGG
jgi:hypothetical protein